MENLRKKIVQKAAKKTATGKMSLKCFAAICRRSIERGQATPWDIRRWVWISQK